jgi:hypothetical protein
MATETLTKLEGAAVHEWATRLASIMDETGCASIGQTEYMIEILTRALTEDGPMVPRLLGARLLDSILTGDKAAGEQDPPIDGLLGQAIDRYLEHCPWW